MTLFKGSVILEVPTSWSDKLLHNLVIADSKPTNNKIKSITTGNDRWESTWNL
jgi:hypothetical protein